MREEARSAKLGRMEDLEDMRREEEEKKRKMAKKKMKRWRAVPFHGIWNAPILKNVTEWKESSVMFPGIGKNVKFKSDTCENPFSFPELRGFLNDNLKRRNAQFPGI